MGKLNIAHHKSYHPYRRDNIERVRKDEEEAKLKEAKEEGRMMLADSEARIDRLRERAGAKSGKTKNDDLSHLVAEGSMKVASLPTSGGHINFFEDLEQNSIIAATRASKKAEPTETEKGVPLAPSAKDLKPWYSESASDQAKEIEGEKRKRDTARKSTHDPLTAITKQLSSRFPTPSSSHKSNFRPPNPPTSKGPPEVQARLSRETSERQRALDLIQRKKREMEGSETPSTVHGGYGDLFNRREVEDAHRGRESRRDYSRGWGSDDRNDRNRGGSNNRRW